MIDISNDEVFALTNSHFSYVFSVTPEGLLEHRYYGAPLRDPHNITRHHFRTQREATTHFCPSSYKMAQIMGQAKRDFSHHVG